MVQVIATGRQELQVEAIEVPIIHNYSLASSICLLSLVVREGQKNPGKGGLYQMQTSRGNRSDNRSGKEECGYT